MIVQAKWEVYSPKWNGRQHR